MDTKPSRQREQQIDDGQETSQTELNVDNHQEETASESETMMDETKTSEGDVDLSCPTCGTNNCEINGCPEAWEVFDEFD